jgi:L-ascorbate metabolism protein UlaG (beta-lactamase superfamily)
MQVKKIGHCCLVIDTGRARILTDPGSYIASHLNEKEMEQGIDIVLITHEHGDHLHIASVAQVLADNPDAEVIANDAVGRLLVAEGISSRTLSSGRLELPNVTIEAFDSPHEEIFEDFNIVQNTGYLIDKTLYIPGDSFHRPNTQVKVLALPVAGPWCRIADSVRYAIEVHPKAAFPIHDGMLKAEARSTQYAVPHAELPKSGIEFIALLDGESHEFDI